MGSCRDCLTRIPYATFIATVLCFIGIGVFCGTVYRGATLANLILLDVFHVQVEWVGIVRLMLIILGGIMAALALIILVVGCLATGSTRHSVYRAWKARVGGRLSCAIVMLSFLISFFLYDFNLPFFYVSNSFLVYRTSYS